MQLTGADIIIECLKEQGVDTVFGYPGGTALNLYDALYKHSDEITHYLTSHEQGASHAADGYARATGSTLAHYDCDHLYVRIYLDESENGTDGWWTLNYWTANAYNNSVATVSSGDYKITKGDYYRVKGAHSVFQDDIVETTTTCTDAVPLK